MLDSDIFQLGRLSVKIFDRFTALDILLCIIDIAQHWNNLFV